MKKLFLDTAGEFFNIAIIENNKVEHFISYKNNNDVSAQAIGYLELFFSKNKISLNEIDGYYFTVGPGSFTGTKVALNIINSFNLVFPVHDFNYITNYDLLKDNEKRYVSIKLTKNKYYLYDFSNHFQKHAKLVDTLEKISERDIVKGYETFNQDVLEQKIANGNFVNVDNLTKINLIYANDSIN